MDIGIAFLLLSHFSTGTVILFHYLAAFQPELNQCLFCWVCLVGLGGNACDAFSEEGKLNSLEGSVR